VLIELSSAPSESPAGQGVSHQGSFRDGRHGNNGSLLHILGGATMISNRSDTWHGQWCRSKVETMRILLKSVVQLGNQAMQLCALYVYASHRQYMSFEFQCAVFLVETILSTVITCQDRDVRRFLLVRSRPVRLVLLCPVIIIFGFGQLIHVKRAWARQIHAAEVMSQLDEAHGHLWAGPALGGEAALPLGFLTGTFTALIAFRSFIVLPTGEFGTQIVSAAAVCAIVMMSLCVVEVDASVSVYVARRYHFDPMRRGSRAGYFQFLFPIFHITLRFAEVLFRVGCLSLLAIILEEHLSWGFALTGLAVLVVGWTVGVATLALNAEQEESVVIHMLVGVALMIANVVRFADMPGFCRPAKLISRLLEIHQALDLLLLCALHYWADWERAKAHADSYFVDERWARGMHVVILASIVYYPLLITIFSVNGDDLHSATAGPRHERLRRMLDPGQGGEALDVNEPQKTRARSTPVMLASAAGDEKALRLLFKAGASVDIVDANGRTAFHYAIDNRKLQVVRLLAKQIGAADVIRKRGVELQQRLREHKFVNRETANEIHYLLTPQSKKRTEKRIGNVNLKPTVVGGSGLNELFPDAVKSDVPPIHELRSVSGLVLAHAVGSLAHFCLETTKRQVAPGEPRNMRSSAGSFEIERFRRVRVIGQGAVGQVIEVEEIGRTLAKDDDSARLSSSSLSIGSLRHLISARVPMLLTAQGSASNSAADLGSPGIPETPSGTFTSTHRFAMKLQQKLQADANWQVCAEAMALQRIAHPFIVRLEHAFQTPQYFVLLLELCAMDMNQKIRTCVDGTGFCHGLPTHAAARYGGQVLLALSYMHQQHRVVYRDMKPQNVLVSFSDEAKLADFGTARYIPETVFKRKMSIVGTCGFLAPEIVYGGDEDEHEEDLESGIHRQHSTETIAARLDPFLPDSFAYGITLAIMLLGEHFAEVGEQEEPYGQQVLLPKTNSEDSQFDLLRECRDAGRLDPQACALLERLVQHRPRFRANLADQEVRGHPFFLDTLKCKDLEAHLMPQSATATTPNTHLSVPDTNASRSSPSVTYSSR